MIKYEQKGKMVEGRQATAAGKGMFFTEETQVVEDETLIIHNINVV